MNLLLMANNGLPRNGLVALYDPFRDTYGRNILPVGSENFVTGWGVVGGETITVTDYPTTININGVDTAVTAKRIQGLGNGSDAWKYRLTSDTGNLVGRTDVVSVYAKLLSGNAKFGNTSMYDAKTLTTSFQRLSSVYPNNTYNERQLIFTVNAKTDVLDIVVYGCCASLGSQLCLYSPPSGLPQSIADYTGRGNNAQLGSAAGADTNDPAYSGQGLTFGADDYVKSSSPAFDDMQEFTCITVCKPLSAGGGSTGRIFDKVQSRLYLTPTLAFTQTLSDGSNNHTAGNVQVNSNNIIAVSYNRQTPLVNAKMFINATKQTVTQSGGFTGSMVSDATFDLYIANNSTATRNFDGTIYLQAWYNRILSDSEYMQAYRYLKSLMNSRGVAI